MVQLFGKRLNGSKVARGFILRQARRKVDDFFVAYNQGEKGPARLSLLIRNNVSLEALATTEQLAGLRATGQRYSWAAKTITEEEFNAMLPGWYWATLLQHGDAGARWHARELSRLKTIFGVGDKA